MTNDKLVTDIPTIRRYAAKRESENWQFRTFVKHRLKLTDAEVDEIVQRTAVSVWSKIDCLSCGNCCKTLQVVVDEEDADRLARRLGISITEFSNQYLDFDNDKVGFLRLSPCRFLDGNACTVYDDRPKACHDFPYLHEPDFRNRMITLIENTATCPIVYHTCEQLKPEFNFPVLPRKSQKPKKID